ncbi:MAG: hypothetical protein M0Z34_00465 [Nitrospiraceae bacterium]|nr:hypothetical protein [Nitrospiraceae bacterium]MDA8263159.1 hypothetical protein [Actinomycetota bacterium]
MGWPDVLDAYEAHLDLVEQAVRGEVPWPGEFVAAEPGEAMGGSLRRRARDLVRRTELLAGVLSEQMRICADVLERSKEREATGRVVLLDLLA